MVAAAGGDVTAVERAGQALTQYSDETVPVRQLSCRAIKQPFVCLIKRIQESFAS
jgi:hypothetical protein